ncbi:unnamed protein product [Linum trigynum]|uniref:BHLH domain-containing protein n=1 Tax=Linum trigynum TaxID=586398 RepID=A0AAV2CDY6_9ROSI
MDNYSDLQDYTTSLHPPTGEQGHDEDMNNNNNNNSCSSMDQRFLLHNHNQSMSSSPSGLEKLMSFADVMQLADFGRPKMPVNHHYQDKAAPVGNSMEDPVYFLKFPVLNDRIITNTNHIEQEQEQVDERRQQQQLMMKMMSSEAPPQMIRLDGVTTRVSGSNNAEASEGQLLQFVANNDQQAGGGTISIVPEGAAVAVAAAKNNNKRKRAPRSIKTSEEVESQRMTHIAVERNRRKQMNEHLRVLRSLMPGSYVQRGDQASIIGGAIEFVRELEQLLQCLESQKRRRLYGEGAGPAAAANIGADSNHSNSIHHHQLHPSSPSFFPTLHGGDDDDDEAAAAALVCFDPSSSGFVVREETAENKSCLADVEVKVLGLDAMIKVLSRRRPGQLIKAIAALEDLHLNILHTNITTIEQTVLYSFNVKVESEGRFTAEEIASSVQHIFTFIHANTTS